MNWRCYVCGKRIGESFTLWSLMKETDRVFLAHDECAKQFDAKDKAVMISVRRIK